jgi:hypothetical protein
MITSEPRRGGRNGGCPLAHNGAPSGLRPFVLAREPRPDGRGYIMSPLSGLKARCTPLAPQSGEARVPTRSVGIETLVIHAKLRRSQQRPC